MYISLVFSSYVYVHTSIEFTDLYNDLDSMPVGKTHLIIHITQFFDSVSSDII